MTSYKTTTTFVACKYAIVVRHIMLLLSVKLSEELVKGLSCEVVTVRMGLNLAIFKEIIHQQNHKPTKIELPVVFFPLRL